MTGEPTANDLPSPRKPRTKIPSVEVILRTRDGGAVSWIGLLTPVTEELTRTLIGIALYGEPADEASASSVVRPAPEGEAGT